MCEKEFISNNTDAVYKAVEKFNRYIDQTGNDVRGATKSSSANVTLALGRKLDSLAAEKASKGFEGDDYYNSLLDE